MYLRQVNLNHIAVNADDSFITFLTPETMNIEKYCISNLYIFHIMSNFVNFHKGVWQPA